VLITIQFASTAENQILWATSHSQNVSVYPVSHNRPQRLPSSVK